MDNKRKWLFAPMLVVYTLLPISSATARRAEDTLLFTVALDGDSGSLRFCSPTLELRKMLSGPVLMKENTFLFFSDRGYVQYDYNGTVVDSHDVFPADKGEDGYSLAYPIDKGSVLFYKRDPDNPDTPILFRKKLGRRRLRKLKEDEVPLFSRVESAYPCNIAHGVVTDEMSVRVYVRPGLVGFTQLTEGVEWWSLEKFFGFTSPILRLRKGQLLGIATGAKSSGRIGRRLNRGLVEPLAAWGAPGLERYIGVYATVGSESEAYHQYLYECDHAGNILYVDTLPKQENEDVVLGENADENMYYTARQTCRFVFQPVVDNNGCIYYGMLDYNRKEIRVFARSPIQYRVEPANDKSELLFSLEKKVNWTPVAVGCGAGRSSGARIPNVKLADAGGRRAEARDLERDGYIVRIFRPPYRDLVKKLSRARMHFPHLKSILDQLLEEPTVECPYSLSLSGPGGVKTTFDYGIGERVLCARVLGVVEPEAVIAVPGNSESDTAHGLLRNEKAGSEGSDRLGKTMRNPQSVRIVTVRVDLKDRAEVLLFADNGNFVNRFIFSREPYETRRDLVTPGDNDEILELDYESDSDGKIVTWTPQVS